MLAGYLTCGGDETSTQSSTSTTSSDAGARERPPTPVDTCFDAGPGWRPVDARANGRRVRAAAIGRGPAVVFLNQSRNDPCVWMGLARRIASDGRSAAVFAYASVDAAHEREAARETLAVAQAAAADGRFVLIGGSLGGRAVFKVAAGSPRGLEGIVSLSGERRVLDYGDILPDVRRVTAPVLYVGSRDDPLTDGTQQPRQLRAALPSRQARFMLLPGFAHGIELLEDPAGRGVTRSIEQFVGQRLR
jgi:pimeloyl-ACP methyl ester carboxylesterase